MSICAPVASVEPSGFDQGDVDLKQRGQHDDHPEAQLLPDVMTTRTRRPKASASQSTFSAASLATSQGHVD